MEEKFRITLELQQDIYTEFKSILDIESKSLSKQVRNLIIEYVNTYKQTQQRLNNVYNNIK